MTEFIKMLDAKVNWHEGYGNSPTLHIIVDADQYESIDRVYHTLESGDNYDTLLSCNKGIGSFGIYFHENEGGLCQRPGTYNVKVKTDDGVEDRTYLTWSSSRSGYINRYIGKVPERVYDCGVQGKYNMAGSVTGAFINSVLGPYLFEKFGLFLLEYSNQRMDGDTGDRHVVASLSPTSFEFPDPVKFKEREFKEDCTITYLFNHK